jgi:uncharacterized OsmC-like protein/ADP-ribosylglycohydrolase
MSLTAMQDRAAGAIMGAFIGDAMGLGPHWYYDLAELRRDYGDWITGYTDPKPGRYHDGCRAGQLSQAGFILNMLLGSLVDRGGYDEADFCRRLDDELLPLLDGTPVSGPGRYTSQSIRELWRQRVEQKRPWGATGGSADTTEAIERTIALAVRYAADPARLAETVAANTLLTQNDPAVVSMTVAYGAVLGQLVQGHPLDERLSGRLMRLVHTGALPFHAVTGDNLQPPRPGDPDPPRAGKFASPDALLTPSYMAAAAADPAIRIEPAWKVSIVYGMPCAIYHQLPAAYFLAARFHDDFESALLNAVNGGGQNQARAILTGALVGAQVGLSRIPQRFLDGLENAVSLGALAMELAAAAVPAGSGLRLPEAPAASHPPSPVADNRVTAVTRVDGFRTEITAGGFPLVADEPAAYGGGNDGPSPYDYLMAALGACTGMTLSLYARRKRWPLTEAVVRIAHDRIHAEDCRDCEGENSRIDRFVRELELRGELDETMRQRLLEIAGQCPVHRTLTGEVRIETTLVDEI